MYHPRADEVLMVVVAANAFIVTAGFNFWLGYRAGGRSRKEEGTDLTRALAQMQQSIDALSFEVERIGEAQRFTAKLLAEGSSARRPSNYVKQITPH